jgi:hypothetical protein
MSESLRPKFIASITFRGFEMPSSQVESLVGVPATELGSRGTSRKLGTTPLQRSFASWELVFADTASLQEMIPALLARVGGADHLQVVQQQVRAEFLEVDLALWVKDSKEQEGGFIDAQSIAMLAQMGATLGFGLYSRNDASLKKHQITD